MHWKTVKMANFMLCVLYHKDKKRKCLNLAWELLTYTDPSAELDSMCAGSVLSTSPTKSCLATPQ